MVRERIEISRFAVGMEHNPEMLCKCGAILADRDRFCASCGTPLLNDAVSAPHILPIPQGPDPDLDDPDEGRVATTDLHTFFWTKMARSAARMLPMNPDLAIVLAYCALVRGQRFAGDTPETLRSSVNSALIELKSLEEATERRLGLTDKQVDPHTFKNLAYLLWEDRSLSAMAASRRYFESISATQLDLAPEDVLMNSNVAFLTELRDWLRRSRIPFSFKPSIFIPSTIVTKTLERFKGLPDLFISPGIPPEKMLNATEILLGDEVVNGLVDCTFWGSAKKCIVIGSRGVYFQTDCKDGFLPYSDFPVRTFGQIGESEVSLGRSLTVSVVGSGLSAGKLALILDELKKEAAAREVGASMTSGIGDLAGMPELKQLLLDEVVAPLLEPEKFRKYGITIPNGILMYGPPGCGKTFVAQRLAAELNRNFFEVGPSAVGSPYIHESGLKFRAFSFLL